MATLVQDESAAAGCLVLGYPFVKRHTNWDRLSHLGGLQKTCWIIQGSNDFYGGKLLVGDLVLSSSIHGHWIEHCDHGFATTSPNQTSTEIMDELHRRIEICLCELLRRRHGLTGCGGLPFHDCY